MKYVFGCLALIGVVVILAIGGCLGLIGIGIAATPKIPDYATRIVIEKLYAKDLKSIDQCLRDKKPESLPKEVSSDIVAIYADHKDILKKVAITSESYSIINGVGVGKLLSHGADYQCLVYQLKVGDADYDIFIVDHGPPARPATSPAP